MNSIYDVLRPDQIKMFSKQELGQLQDLIDANQVFTFIISGLIDFDPKWRSILAYSYKKEVLGRSRSSNSKNQISKTRIDPFSSDLDSTAATGLML